MNPILHAQILSIWDNVNRMAHQLWTCRHCGTKTTILSEVCTGCHREDLLQGTE